MNRAKLLRLSFGLSKSLSSTSTSTSTTRISGLNRVEFTQVTRFSHFTQFHLPISLPKIAFTGNNPINFRQILFFSSKHESFIDLVLSNDNWSDEIEIELEKLNPNLTHESVTYVLMLLNKNPQKCLDFFKWVCVKKQFCPSFTPYVILLRSLACKGFMDKFWDIFSEMKEKGFYFNVKAYSSINGNFTFEKMNEESVELTKKYQEIVEFDPDKDVAKSVLLLISSFDWGDELKVRLKKILKFPLKECFVLRMISDMREQPLKALKFFDWVGSCGGYEHDSVTYNAMAQVLAHHESLDEFRDFVKRMRIQGFDIDMYTYTGSCKFLPDKDVVELFELLMDGPYRPSRGHAELLLSSIAAKPEPDLDLVYRVFNKFVAAGNAPTNILYRNLHKALCNLGKFDEAEKIVEELKRSGYKPDNYIYSQEIHGLCKLGRLDEAGKVIERMEAEGCVPDIKTWGNLIDGHIAAKRSDLALYWFETTRQKNVSQSPEILWILVKGLISNNEIPTAYIVFTELASKKGGLKPSLKTCQLMIKTLAEDGKLEEACNVLRLMDGPYRPSREHTELLLSSIATKHEPDLDLVYRVSNKFGAASNAPTNILYRYLHRALCNLGKFDEAEKIVEELKRSGYKPDNYIYSQEIHSLCKLGRLDEAGKVIERMEAEGCVPDVKTWGKLIDGHIAAKRSDLALLWFETTRQKNVGQSPEILWILVKGLISNNEIPTAYRVFTELASNERGLKPSLKTCQLMLETLAEDGKLEEAFNVLRLMKKLCFGVYPQPITNYISKCGTVGDAQRLLTVLSPRHELSPNVYGKVIRAFHERGRFSDVQKLVFSSPLHVRQDPAIRKMVGSVVAPLIIVRASK